MSELRRWSEEGAAPGEILALEAARERQPSSEARTRILSAVGVGTTIAATSATTAAATGAGGASLFAKIVFATVVVVAGGGAVWKFARPAARDVAPGLEASARSEQPTPPRDEEPTPREPPAEEPAVREPIATPSAAPAAPEPAHTAAPKTEAAPRPKAPRAASSGLSAEVAALERARHALDSNSPDAALRELGDYDKKFPRGSLGAEQVVLRVQALLASGDRARAVAVADQFAAAHPESPYARRVQELVRSARQK